MASRTTRSASYVGKRPSKAAGILHGVGLGGFIDGIVLPQILQ